jgi:hypothetical protein
MSEFIAALAGAVVGGVLTFFASWRQTKRVLQHETAQARAAAEEQRREARHAVSRMAVLELLPALAEAEGAISAGSSDTNDFRTLDLIGSAKSARVSLLPDAIQKRWGYLTHPCRSALRG